MSGEGKQFSRRYRTSAEHLVAQAKKEARVSLWAEGIEVRAQERAERSPLQQITLLNKRLGAGQGAKKERHRLWLQIEQNRVAKAVSDHQESKPKKKEKTK